MGVYRPWLIGFLSYSTVDKVGQEHDDIRQEYEKQCALIALGKIYQIPAEKRRDDFCAFVNDTWFLLQVRDGKHKPKKIAFYESTQFAGLINMIDLGRAFSILLSGDR